MSLKHWINHFPSLETATHNKRIFEMTFDNRWILFTVLMFRAAEHLSISNESVELITYKIQTRKMKWCATIKLLEMTPFRPIVNKCVKHKRFKQSFSWIAMRHRSDACQRIKCVVSFYWWKSVELKMHLVESYSVAWKIGCWLIGAKTIQVESGARSTPWAWNQSLIFQLESVFNLLVCGWLVHNQYKWWHTSHERLDRVQWLRKWIMKLTRDCKKEIAYFSLAFC